MIGCVHGPHQQHSYHAMDPTQGGMCPSGGCSCTHGSRVEHMSPGLGTRTHTVRQLHHESNQRTPSCHLGTLRLGGLDRAPPLLDEVHLVRSFDACYLACSRP